MNAFIATLAATFVVGSVYGTSISASSTRQPAPARSGTIDPMKFQRVEAIVADRGPLSMSLRRFDADLRLPQGFDRVYQLPRGTDLTRFGVRGHGGASFARVMGSGGLVAVFPQSVYAFTDEVTLPMIPAGTAFFVGGLPATQTREAGTAGAVSAMNTRQVQPVGSAVASRREGQAPASMRVDRSQSPSGHPAAGASQAPARHGAGRTLPASDREGTTGIADESSLSPGRGIMTNEEYRLARLARLMGM